MKVLFKSFCFAFFALMSVTDSYAESFQLRGEVYHEDGKKRWTRGLLSSIQSGTPFLLKQNNQVLSFLFVVEPPPSNKYSLTLTVSNIKNPDSPTEISVEVLSHKFQSTLVGGNNGPYEFEKEQNGIKIGGIIGIAPLR